MNEIELASNIEQITKDLIDSELNPYINVNIKAPAPYRGRGEIKLIVLGQDPTVQDPKYREKIKVTLLLNRYGGLRTYLTNISSSLGFSLQNNVYATNLLKNFFSKPPFQIEEERAGFLSQASLFWVPLLVEEIEEFPNVPVLSLGEPVLNCLMKTSDRILMRNFWGYIAPAKYGKDFLYIPPKENVLNRIIFPFPHIPALKYKFYQDQMSGYLEFMKRIITSRKVS